MESKSEMDSFSCNGMAIDNSDDQEMHPQGSSRPRNQSLTSRMIAQSSSSCFQSTTTSSYSLTPDASIPPFLCVARYVKGANSEEENMDPKDDSIDENLLHDAHVLSQNDSIYFYDEKRFYTCPNPMATTLLMNDGNEEQIKATSELSKTSSRTGSSRSSSASLSSCASECEISHCLSCKCEATLCNTKNQNVTHKTLKSNSLGRQARRLGNGIVSKGSRQHKVKVMQSQVSLSPSKTTLANTHLKRTRANNKIHPDSVLTSPSPTRGLPLQRYPLKKLTGNLVDIMDQDSRASLVKPVAIRRVAPTSAVTTFSLDMQALLA